LATEDLLRLRTINPLSTLWVATPFVKGGCAATPRSFVVPKAKPYYAQDDALATLRASGDRRRYATPSPVGEGYIHHISPLKFLHRISSTAHTGECGGVYEIKLW
jgi:hypothetical protein